ncbi:hypothetical protein EGI26_03475 [Lacihabitans sp. CCS-44]|uniref:hypothetical protein n=1 Tax=Lacihabitans sp. CCS-44 TaxID=2487331 RepID=UPI0020CBA929|nr:hypothetical protein [Lacihabitans sp. CCS-44]MCP9754223.1 hypothetical protein [Lacihabitans sp. CCS-44]
MDLQTSKIELIKMILEIDNFDLIQGISNILKKKETDFWTELTTDEKEEIKLGIQQLDNGHRVSFEDFLRKVS